MNMTELFGEPISVYTREQAIADGVLVDVAEWASADKGFIGGFHCSVVLTAALWAVVNIDGRARKPVGQSTRGRAHDVLWMASLALRGANRRSGERRESYHRNFRLLLTHGRKKNAVLRVVADADGVTIGFPEDF